MAIQKPGQMITVPASTQVLSTTSVNWQFRFVALDANGEAIAPAGSTAPIFGVLQNKPDRDTAAATIMIDGVSKVQAAGSTVGTGDAIAASTAGMVVAWASGDYRVGQVIEGTSGTTGRLLSVVLQEIGTT